MSFSFKGALGGACVGLVTAWVATSQGQSKWWWLAVPVAAVWAGFSEGGSGSSDGFWGWGDGDSGGDGGDGE